MRLGTNIVSSCQVTKGDISWLWYLMFRNLNFSSLKRMTTKEYWTKVINMIIYILNFNPTNTNGAKVFRYLAYGYIEFKLRINIELNSILCVLVGYSNTSKAYYFIIKSPKIS